jgi:HTH-type transcriptional regulator/antitoxin HigA
LTFSGCNKPREVLRLLIEKNGLKQIDLSDEIDRQSVVSAILSGKHEINARQTKALAARFGVSAAALI